MTLRERILGGLWGSVIGDTLGVPVEFTNREALRPNPVTGLREFGVHHQPRGTWSDDTSLTLCTIESLLHSEFDLEDMGQRFVEWMNGGLWTPWGNVFDVGRATAKALMNIAEGIPATESGGRAESDNGNGSLMRILPVSIRFAHGSPGRFLKRLHQASAITHAHLRSQMACAFHGLITSELLKGSGVVLAFDIARHLFESTYCEDSQLPSFNRILQNDLLVQPEALIYSTGYVIDTLSASVWCLLTSRGCDECVLKAVNLGGDTDTTGCVAGGLAGLHYGVGRGPTPLARCYRAGCRFGEALPCLCRSCYRLSCQTCDLTLLSAIVSASRD